MAEWKVERIRAGAVLVTVEGAVLVDDASDAARRVMELVDRDGVPIDLCFDIRQIASYSVKAREDWSELLRTRRDKVRSLTWVTARTTHRMVGRAVGLFTGIPTSIVEQLPAYLVDAS